MKRFRCLVATLCLGGSLVAGWGPPGWADPQPHPLPSGAPAGTSGRDDAGLLLLLNAQRSDQEPLTADRVRFRRLFWAGAVAVGYVTDNRSCLIGSVVLGDRVLRPRQASVEMLRQAGWAEASPEDRVNLARRFVEQVMLAFGDEIVQQAPPNFPVDAKKKALFTVPQFRRTGTDGVVVTAWIRETGGEGITIYRKSQFDFSAQGEMVHVRVLDRVVLEE